MASEPEISTGTSDASTPESRRAIALRLAVDLRRSQDRDITSGYVTRTARAFEAYLENGAVER